MYRDFRTPILVTLVAWLAAGTSIAAQPGSGAIPLPPVPSIDDVAWAPLAGDKLLLTTDGSSTMWVLDAKGAKTEERYVPLTRIRDMRALADGSLVLGDSRTGRIYHVAADGKLLGSAGARGFDNGQFLQRDRVEIDSQKRLYGLDGSELRILRFSSKGDFEGAFSTESGPVLDGKDRVLAVQDKLTSGIRRLVAMSAPGKESVLYQGRLEPGSRWEPVCALSDGTILVRALDLSGRVSIVPIGEGGKVGEAVPLAADALLAGPTRLTAVDPEEKRLYYIAGNGQGFRVESVPVPR